MITSATVEISTNLLLSTPDLATLSVYKPTGTLSVAVMESVLIAEGIITRVSPQITGVSLITEVNVSFVKALPGIII